MAPAVSQFVGNIQWVERQQVDEHMTDESWSLSGTLFLSHTCGKFHEFMTDNSAVFREFFGVDLFPGSLNILIPERPSLHDEMDEGRIQPAFVIPQDRLKGRWQPTRLGSGQAWRCHLEGVGAGVHGWVFRRLRSRVPRSVVEFLAAEELVKPFELADGDSVQLTVFAGS